MTTNNKPCPLCAEKEEQIRELITECSNKTDKLKQYENLASIAKILDAYIAHGVQKELLKPNLVHWR